MDFKTIISILAGGFLSLLTSWLVAERYFKRQRIIDDERARADVELSYSRLVHAYFGFYGKRLKNPSTVHHAMSELQNKLKIYNREFDAQPLILQAADQAQQTIKDNSDDFENCRL